MSAASKLAPCNGGLPGPSCACFQARCARCKRHRIDTSSAGRHFVRVTTGDVEELVCHDCHVNMQLDSSRVLKPYDELTAALAGLGARLVTMVGDLGRHDLGLQVEMYELRNGERVLVQRQAYGAVELWLPQEKSTAQLIEKLHQLATI